MSNYVQQRLAELKGQTELKRMSATPRRYIVKETTRHGKTVYYYRKKGGQRIRLPDPDIIGSAAFNQAYLLAVRGEHPEPWRIKPEPVKALKASGTRGFVYFLRTGDVVKIGFARNVHRRVRSMTTALSEAPEVLKVIPGTDETERYFHAHFDAYRQKGEWFRLEGALAAFLSVEC